MQLQGNVRHVVDETAVSVFEYSSSRVHAVGRSLAAGAEWVGDSTGRVCFGAAGLEASAGKGCCHQQRQGELSVLLHFGRVDRMVG
jgi:hypothetical protein